MPNLKYISFALVLGSLFYINIHISKADDNENLNLPATDERPALPFTKDDKAVIESICGLEDESQDVELYDGSLGVPKSYVELHEPSTVQFQWKDRNEIERALGENSDAGTIARERWCSGTLFQKEDENGHIIDYVLTAAHCFDSDPPDWTTPKIDGRFITPEQNAQQMIVNMNYQRNEFGVIRTAAQYEVASLEEYSIGDLDYAIIRLGDFRGGDSSYKIEYAVLEPRDLIDNEDLIIIQHPQGEPKKIEVGQLLKTSTNLAFYDNIDTHGGSSGSGVRDSNGKIVAVHTNAGCTIDGGANRGVLLKSIFHVSSIL